MVIENVRVPALDGFVDEEATHIKVNRNKGRLPSVALCRLKNCQPFSLLGLSRPLKKLVKVRIFQALWLLPESEMPKLKGIGIEVVTDPSRTRDIKSPACREFK